MLSGKWFDKDRRFHAQCVRQLDDVDQTDIALTALNPANVVSVEVRQLRQAFLRQTAFCPQLADTSSKQHARVWLSHLRSWCEVNTISSTHYRCDIKKSHAGNRSGR